NLSSKTAVRRDPVEKSIAADLIEKAQELLSSNGNKYSLDVVPKRKVLSQMTTDISDGGTCDENTEITEVGRLAEAAGFEGTDRLPVIFYTGLGTTNNFGDANEQLANRCTTKTAKGRKYSTINLRSLGEDKVTLLHEIGHAADLGHEFSAQKNFMSYGVDNKCKGRTDINPIQIQKLEKAYFCGK